MIKLTKAQADYVSALLGEQEIAISIIDRARREFRDKSNSAEVREAAFERMERWYKVQETNQAEMKRLGLERAIRYC